jgi:hypothetical protein
MKGWGTMNRRSFLCKTASLALTTLAAPALAGVFASKMDRIAMGTLIFRYRFKQTKPKQWATIKNPLTLEEVPKYYRDRFGIRDIEFWGMHLESNEPAYIAKLRKSVEAADARLLNVQFDFTQDYDLATPKEDFRLQSVKLCKQWIDTCAALGTQCVRINPGHPKGTVEKSIESLKEVNEHAREKGIIVITANHFGLEMNPDYHVRIVKESGPGNIYTEPDFGNYSHAALFTSLPKVVPYAYIVSAKTDEFNDQMEHTSYDFDKCVQLCESLGFKGQYMVAQYSGKFQDIDYEKVADWTIEHLKKNMATPTA